MAGWNYFDVLAAEGQYLTTNVDPRVGAGLDYAFGTLVTYAPKTGAAIVLQKQSALGTNPTDWVPVGGGGGGVASINGAAGVINILAGANITVTTVGPNITIAAASAGLATKHIIGTEIAPVLLTGISEITFVDNTDYYVAGSGGPVTLGPANFSPIPVDGSWLTIIGESNLNTVTIVPSGILKMNGQCVLKQNSIITFRSTGTNLQEVSRNDL